MAAQPCDRRGDGSTRRAADGPRSGAWLATLGGSIRTVLVDRPAIGPDASDSIPPDFLGCPCLRKQTFCLRPPHCLSDANLWSTSFGMALIKPPSSPDVSR